MPSRQDVWIELRRMIAEATETPEDKIVEGSTLEDVKADSLAVVEVAEAIEEWWDIVLVEDDLEDLKNTRDVLDIVMAKLEAA